MFGRLPLPKTPTTSMTYKNKHYTAVVVGKSVSISRKHTKTMGNKKSIPQATADMSPTNRASRQNNPIEFHLFGFPSTNTYVQNWQVTSRDLEYLHYLIL